MYTQPQSLLSRLLGAAWTILIICGLLWLAVHLLAEVWLWVVVVVVLFALVRAASWWHRLRREFW